MNDDDYDRARELFDHAEALDGEAREEYLQRACADDPALRRRVEALLDARARLGRFLESPATSWRDEKIGGFTVDEVIAEGGMGIVLRATQDQPRRSVAIKIIRGFGIGKHAEQRFELEAEVLGRLDHPGVARIYEAGTAQRGGNTYPYFVMEYIEGQPLTRFVQERALPQRERIALIAAVCEAVHHAHLRGVIHRDLKPSNILVRDDGSPKVLDFGVARVTDADLKWTTFQTQVGQVVGTLPYMSPEQVAGRNHELDLRSDIFSLGVLLFESLTGELPQRLEDRSLAEAARWITEEPARTLAATGGRFPADLETIVAKCLRKEPAERYESALELASDLRRYLRDEPISARPPSAVYHWSKFARRNRAVVAWAATSLVLLVAGLLTSLVGWSTARRERNNAISSAAQATELSSFLVEFLASPDPRQDGGDVRVRDLLDRASERSRESLGDRPAIAARVHQALGLSYRGLGLDDHALEELRTAVEASRSLGGLQGQRRYCEALLDLGNLYFEIGEYDAVDSLNVEIERLIPVPVDDRQLAFRYELQLGQLAGGRRQFDQAEAIFDRALRAARAELGPEHRATLDLQSELGVVYWQQQRPEDARDIFERQLESETRAYGPEHPITLKLVNNLGMVYRQLEDYPNSRVMLERGLDAKLRTLGADHPSTATGHHNLALVLRELGEFELAEAHHRRATTTVDSLLAASDPRRPHFRAGYAGTLYRMERYEEARANYLACYEPLLEMYGSEHERMQAIFQEMEACSDRLGLPEEASRWRALREGG